MELNRGLWRPDEDLRLRNYIEAHGEGRWTTLPQKPGLLRSGKSCRLRWMNYLRPNVKRGHILPDEEDLICTLHRLLGNRWSLIAGRMPGRTDNEIKNYWNTHLRKKLLSQGIDPCTHKPLPESQDVMCSSPRKRETSQNPENIVDSRADLQEVASKVAIIARGNEDYHAAAATGCAIADLVTLRSDPCLITPSAALGDFNSDIFPFQVLESFVDEELHLQEPPEPIYVEQNVELWPLTFLEAANLTDDLWCIPLQSG